MVQKETSGMKCKLKDKEKFKQKEIEEITEKLKGRHREQMVEKLKKAERTEMTQKLKQTERRHNREFKTNRESRKK